MFPTSHRSFRIQCTLLLCGCLLASDAVADLQAGVDAYMRGDYEVSFREFSALAEQGDATAQYNLGVMYDNGEGVPKNDVEAVKWYRLAAEQGDATAQSNLGVMYANGEGVPKNDVEAVKWYRLAAEQGVASAQFNLGFMYYKGEGVPEDLVYAYAWWNLAAAQGHGGASKIRKIVRSRMTPQQVAEAQMLSRELVKTLPMTWQGSTQSAAAKPRDESSQLVREVQSELAALGFTPGPADGLTGPKTVAAVRAFQRSIGLPESGQVSAELLMLLQSQR